MHGELARIFAEQPSIRPGELLTLLNRYVFLTMSSHSVYATAICFRLDHREGRLEYASGGHPPAFIRTADGRLEQLDSTSFVLGAVPPDDFHAEPRTLRFAIGDALIAYTDGLTEARDQHGRMFGVDGLRRALINPTLDAEGSMLPGINRAVAGHRFGPTEDDILIIEIRCPVAPAVAHPSAPAGGSAPRPARPRA
ncbi:serine/threonine-protein phosphatase [Leptolyngbya sp. 15MV]|nr:serine/threonine-protein phosphatase [Leptolyngbya sp. 15MV]